MTAQHSRLAMLGALLALPATLAHETTHAIASLPWASRLALVVEPRSGRATVRVEWHDSAGQWARRIAALAPFVAGVLAAVAGAALWMAGAGPLNDAGLLEWSIVAAWWTVFMLPSRPDVATARGESE